MNAKFFKFVILLIFLSTLANASKSFAQNTSSPDYGANPIYYATPNPPKEHTFELSQEDGYSNFKEPGDFKRTGGFYGINVAYTYKPSVAADWMVNVFHIEMHGDYGLVKYNYFGDGPINNVNNYMAEPRIWIGREINLNPFIDVTPYAGFGYRWYFEQLKNKFSDSNDDDGGNNIQTQYFYIPVGAQIAVRPTNGWHLVFTGEYDFLAWARITNESANFTVNSVDVSSPQYSNSVRQGYGIRGSIKIVKEGDLVNYFVEPYIRYWHIDDSNTVSATGSVGGTPETTSIQEDANHNTEIGARLGVEF